MIDVKRPVLLDCRVARLENCFPMIRPGRAHNDMLLPDEITGASFRGPVDPAGQSLV
jgi:acetolactate synthase-1/2/3 large subunit